MALKTTQAITVTGTAPTFAAATVSDTFNPGGFAVYKNGGGSSITVTVVIPGNLASGDAIPDKVYTIAAGAEAWIPLLQYYQDTTTGLITITASGVTSVTSAAVALVI